MARAKEQGIPVVSEDFLRDCIAAGSVLDARPYLIRHVSAQVSIALLLLWSQTSHRGLSQPLQQRKNRLERL